MLKLQYFGHLMQRADSLEKALMLEKIEEEKRVTEDERKDPCLHAAQMLAIATTPPALLQEILMRCESS